MNSSESSNFATDVRLLTSRAPKIGRRGVGEGGRRHGIWSDDAGTVAFGSVNHEPTDLRSSWNAYRSSQRLTRSRSMIRTNPWIGSAESGGDSPPLSPGQKMPPPLQYSSLPPPPPLMCRSWSMVETGKTPTSTTTKAQPPPRFSTNRFNSNEYSNNKYSNNEYSNNIKYPMYSRDSLLTTSIETDSFCPSEFSDAETTTSLTSFGDVCLTPTESDWRLSDVISYDPPTKRGVRRAGCGDGDDYEDDKFLFEPLNTEKIRQIRKQRVNISSFSSSGLKQPGVERGPKVNWEGQVSKSVQTKGEDSGVQAKPYFSQRTKKHASYSIEGDEPFRDSESKRASGSLQRKILTIRSGLRDKVELLKHEKKVVDQKIREAKEEERIRIRQLEKFRQQLAQTKREILLRTLEDIKRTLALQVLRLQKVYDFVLLEQRQSFDCQ